MASVKNYKTENGKHRWKATVYIGVDQKQDVRNMQLEVVKQLGKRQSVQAKSLKRQCKMVN